MGIPQSARNMQPNLGLQQIPLNLGFQKSSYTSELWPITNNTYEYWFATTADTEPSVTTTATMSSAQNYMQHTSNVNFVAGTFNCLQIIIFLQLRTMTFT